MYYLNTIIVNIETTTINVSDKCDQTIGRKKLEFQGSRVSATFRDAIGWQGNAVYARSLNHLAVSRHETRQKRGIHGTLIFSGLFMRIL